MYTEPTQMNAEELHNHQKNFTLQMKNLIKELKKAKRNMFWANIRLRIASFVALFRRTQKEGWPDGD
jgi:hypothetical protein